MKNDLKENTGCEIEKLTPDSSVTSVSVTMVLLRSLKLTLLWIEWIPKSASSKPSARRVKWNRRSGKRKIRGPWSPIVGQEY